MFTYSHSSATRGCAAKHGSGARPLWSQVDPSDYTLDNCAVFLLLLRCVLSDPVPLPSRFVCFCFISFSPDETLKDADGDYFCLTVCVVMFGLMWKKNMNEAAAAGTTKYQKLLIFLHITMNLIGFVCDRPTPWNVLLWNVATWLSKEKSGRKIWKVWHVFVIIFLAIH